MANGHDKPGTFLVIAIGADGNALQKALDAAVAQGYDPDSLKLNNSFAILYRKS